MLFTRFVVTLFTVTQAKFRTSLFQAIRRPGVIPVRPSQTAAERPARVRQIRSQIAIFPLNSRRRRTQANRSERFRMALPGRNAMTRVRQAASRARAETFRGNTGQWMQRNTGSVRRRSQRQNIRRGSLRQNTRRGSQRQDTRRGSQRQQVTRRRR